MHGEAHSASHGVHADRGCMAQARREDASTHDASQSILSSYADIALEQMRDLQERLQETRMPEGGAVARCAIRDILDQNPHFFDRAMSSYTHQNRSRNPSIPERLLPWGTAAIGACAAQGIYHMCFGS